VEVKCNVTRNFHCCLLWIITLVQLHLACKYFVDVFRREQEAIENASNALANKLPITCSHGRGAKTNAIESLFCEVELSLAATLAHNN
jgi:hypothetical protein